MSIITIGTSETGKCVSGVQWQSMGNWKGISGLVKKDIIMCTFHSCTKIGRKKNKRVLLFFMLHNNIEMTAVQHGIIDCSVLAKYILEFLE